ncbi:Uncharacterized protein FWK35_00021895 [Aphis craccivora]|uniref:Uncharacterized protein n=1 Tax=Aphis craccivora TaxID=307492 RepID=A0A6G0ZBU9_APHCR|nr:Uncharacterized protein FWK35_00021895 [Aphis craccivora]
MHLGQTDCSRRTSNRIHLLTDLYFCIKSGVIYNDKRGSARSMEPVRIRRPSLAVYDLAAKGVLQVEDAVTVLEEEGFP